MEVSNFDYKILHIECQISLPWSCRVDFNVQTNLGYITQWNDTDIVLAQHVQVHHRSSIVVTQSPDFF